jgi:hypothetical protein
VRIPMDSRYFRVREVCSSDSARWAPVMVCTLSGDWATPQRYGGKVARAM